MRIGTFIKSTIVSLTVAGGLLASTPLAGAQANFEEVDRGRLERACAARGGTLREVAWWLICSGPDGEIFECFGGDEDGLDVWDCTLSLTLAEADSNIDSRDLSDLTDVPAVGGALANNSVVSARGHLDG